MSQGNGNDPTQAPATAVFVAPPKRNFVVRKFTYGETAPVEQEIHVSAHLLSPMEPNIIQFLDVVVDEQGPVSRIRRVIYNVEDVEEIFTPDTVLQKKSLLLH